MYLPMSSASIITKLVGVDSEVASVAHTRTSVVRTIISLLIGELHRSVCNLFLECNRHDQLRLYL